MFPQALFQKGVQTTIPSPVGNNHARRSPSMSPVTILSNSNPSNNSTIVTMEQQQPQQTSNNIILTRHDVGEPQKVVLKQEKYTLPSWNMQTDVTSQCITSSHMTSSPVSVAVYKPKAEPVVTVTATTNNHSNGSSGVGSGDFTNLFVNDTLSKDKMLERQQKVSYKLYGSCYEGVSFGGKRDHQKHIL